MAALTPSPTFSSPDSDTTEPAEEQSVGEEEDLEDDVFPEHALCDGRDPFYDRPPLFSLVGRLVRSRPACWEGRSQLFGTGELLRANLTVRAWPRGRAAEGLAFRGGCEGAQGLWAALETRGSWGPSYGRDRCPGARPQAPCRWHCTAQALEPGTWPLGPQEESLCRAPQGTFGKEGGAGRPQGPVVLGFRPHFS